MENRVDVTKIAKNYPKFTFFSNMFVDVAMILFDSFKDIINSTNKVKL